MIALGAPTHIEIPFCWKPLLVNEKHFAWHRGDLYKSHTNLIYGARGYRWLMSSESGEPEFVYIGESVKFDERLLKYRLRFQRPSEKDNLVKAMLACEDRGGIVELQFLDLGVDGFHLNGQFINSGSIGDHEVRLMMENIAILLAKSTSLRLINKLRESASSRAERWIMAYADKHGARATLELIESSRRILKKECL